MLDEGGQKKRALPEASRPPGQDFFSVNGNKGGGTAWFGAYSRKRAAQTPTPRARSNPLGPFQRASAQKNYPQRLTFDRGRSTPGAFSRFSPRIRAPPPRQFGGGAFPGQDRSGFLASGRLQNNRHRRRGSTKLARHPPQGQEPTSAPIPGRCIVHQQTQQNQDGFQGLLGTMGFGR